jgi:hypothetical protein
MVLSLLLLMLLTQGVCAFNIVVDGSSGAGLEVQLIAGKLAARAGHVCHIMTATDEKSLRRNRALMYGQEATSTASPDIDGRYAGPWFVSDPEDIGDALSNANGLILFSLEDKTMSESKVDIFLRNTPKFSHVSMQSQIGGVHGKLEEHLKAACRERNVECSSIRSGILKGGGPGDGGDADHNVCRGLDKFYYSTLFELMLAQNTMAFDRFTLGVKVVAGDVYKAPNLFDKMSANQSFDPSDIDTGRTAAAAALLAVLERRKGVDISLSTAKGNVPPTTAEWDELLSSVSP